MSTASTSGPERNVLLLEEYDALAVAIQSALTKFAPQHRTHVNSILAEARTTALEVKPELIIIDFDPPQSGAIAFVQELRAALPATRVLVIAAGTSRELAAERGTRGALQFLEKPFELVDFGAAVQALLGPGASRGTLRDLDLLDIAVLGCLGGISAVVQVRGDGDRAGELHLQSGRLTHATAAGIDGQNALVEMILWRDARFVETERRSDAPQSLAGPWSKMLLDAWREAKKRAAVLPAAPAPPETKVLTPSAKTGSKILVIDDTEMLLIFVQDSLALADPTLQITTVDSGLKGVAEAARLRPDLALVDYSIPDLRGDEVCRRLLNTPETSRLPVVMMSGHVAEMAAAAKKLPNIVATIAKPFLSDAFVALVMETLKKGPLPEGLTLPAEPQAAEVPLAKSIPPPLPSVAKSPPKAGSPTLQQPSAQPASIAQPPSSITREQIGAIRPPKMPMVPPSIAIKPVRGPESTSPATTKPESVPPAATKVREVKELAATVPRLGTNEVLLDLPLEVVAMQFTSAFQIGSIRARLASPTVAIQIPALAARAALPLTTGFQLGEIDLDAAGHIATVRLLPTAQPFRAVTTNGAFDIDGMAIVPANEHEQLQLTSSAASTMTMQLFAPLELQSVELNADMEVRQLVLRCRGNAVRVTLNSAASSAHSGASFITTQVELDEARRISELTLAPANDR